MEKGLRDCCRSIRIGKILIRREQESKKPKVMVCLWCASIQVYLNLSPALQVYYAKFPPQIEKRKVLLLSPTLGERQRHVCGSHSTHSSM